MIRSTPFQPRRPRCVEGFHCIAIILLVSACSGSSGKSTDGPTSPPAPSPSSVTSSGVVYVRDDTTAYLPDFVPATGLAGASVTLGSSTSMTSAGGAFTVNGGASVARNFDALQATASGWMTTWFPWYTAEAAKPIPLALYPEATPTQRPGFLKGVYYWDGGGYVAGFVRNGWAPTTAERVKTVMNGNIMGMVDNLEVAAVDTAANTVSLRRVSTAVSASLLRTMVNEAHSRGMKFIFLMDIRGIGVVEKLPATKTAFWDAYFASWTPLIVETATMARDAGVDYLIVENNKPYLSRLPIARMQALMPAIRATGFKGQLGYGGYYLGSVKINELARATAGFIDLFDFVSVYVGSAVIPVGNETLGRAYSRKRIKADVQTLLSTVGGWPRPTIIVPEMASVHGAVSTAEYIEPCLPCGGVALARTRDYQQQADFYEALAEAINASPTGTGAGKVIGLMSYGYMWGGDMTEDPNGPGSAAFDRSASVRGKPAEAVLSWWFKRW